MASQIMLACHWNVVYRNRPFLLVQAVWGQSTTSFTTEPTVASWATVGVAQTPTVSNPAAVVAQEVCPGYSLSNIQKSGSGVDWFVKFRWLCLQCIRPRITRI